MGKRNKYGGYIPGVTEVHDRGFFEAYLKDRNWEKGDRWLHTEVCYLHNKVVHGQTVYNVLGFLLSTVLAFFTWIMMVPDMTPEELEAVLPARFCNDLFIKLTELVPYGKPAVIAGLLLLPFLVASILALLLLPMKSRRFAKKMKSKGQLSHLQEMKRKLARLSKDYRTYDDGHYIMILYALWGGILTGGLMLFYSGGKNLLECLFIGAVFTVLYGLILWGIAALIGVFVHNFGVKWYPLFDWQSTVSWELGERSYVEEETPVQIPDPEEERKIKEFLDGIYDDLSGKGYGNY